MKSLSADGVLSLHFLLSHSAQLGWQRFQFYARNEVLGTYICQRLVDPRTIECGQKKRPLEISNHLTRKEHVRVPERSASPLAEMRKLDQLK
jgi:hypothetical protein